MIDAIIRHGVEIPNNSLIGFIEDIAIRIEVALSLTTSRNLKLVILFSFHVKHHQEDVWTGLNCVLFQLVEGKCHLW